jgi:hypothetical protein
MNATLASVMQWVEEAYRSQLGAEVRDVDAADVSSSIAVWRKSSVENSTTVELLDRELGVWVRFEAFGRDVVLEVLSEGVERGIQWGLRELAALAPRQKTVASDDRGGWQIHLVWLVPERHRLGWCEKLQRIRRESGYSEELGLDAIFYGDNKINSALNSHRLPQLLLTVRKLLGLSNDLMPQWLQANSMFAEAIAKLSDRVGPTDKLRATEFVENLLSSYSRAAPMNGAQKERLQRTYQKLEVSSVRNIDQATLLLPPGTVTVVYGPNGSGKSSLFEALMLGVAGASNTLRDYMSADEKDVPLKEKRSYLQKVLRNRYSKGATTACIQLDDQGNALSRLSFEFDEVVRCVREGLINSKPRAA